LLVILLVLMSPIAQFFNVGFIPMLADVIPEDRRAAVFTARNMVVNAALSVFVFLCGQWLNHIVFPLNYQLMYTFGFLTSLMSLYFLIKVQVPEKPVSIVESPQRTLNPDGRPLLRRLVIAPVNALKAQWIAVQEAFKSHPRFLRITRNTVFHGLGLWMATPLYIVYFVRGLGASDAWLGVQGTTSSLATIAGFAFWRWIMTRWGEPKTLRRTIVLLGSYPILAGLLPSLNLILIAVALNGLLSPGVSLSHLNSLLKVTPADKRPEYTAIYYTIVNAFAFICPLIGVAIANHFGLPHTLIFCGILSILGSTSFWWWPVRNDNE
jgi:Na+/melibiose symporter-like transporter